MLSKIFSLLPSFKGKRRLSRILLKKTIEHSYELTVLGKDNCKYKIPNAKETVGFELLINGVYEPDTISFIIKQLKPGKIFLDIGANIGAICVPVCKKRTDVNAVCLEAAPWVFNYLEENIRMNGIENATLVNKAVSNQPDTVIQFYSPNEKYGKGSMAPVFTHEGVDMLTTTLDQIAASLQQPVGFIKIDIEGFEWMAFEGGESLLRNQGPDILFEFVDWAESSAIPGQVGKAQEVLMHYGYTLYPFEYGKLADPIAEPLRKGSTLLFASKN